MAPQRSIGFLAAQHHGRPGATEHPGGPQRRLERRTARHAERHSADLPGSPDAAYVGVNRNLTIDIVRDLAARGAGGAICYATGFTEAGEEGSELEKQLLDAYYAFKGWNEDGVPTRETLETLDLAYVADDLEERGILARAKQGAAS